MIPKSLVTRLLLVSCPVLCLFGAATLGLTYRAQKRLAIKAMDSLLNDDAFSLSALVNAIPGGKFDFEITPLALSNYQNTQAGEFFRFIDMDLAQSLRESLGAPEVPCSLSTVGSSISDLQMNSKTYRVHTSVFQPEIDEDYKNIPPFPRNRICLVVGVDQSLYFGFVHQTIVSVIPLLIGLILIFVFVLLSLLRFLTRDLTSLSDALQISNFALTHEFPNLPAAKTYEINSLVEKLRALHEQAAKVYEEMWLFLGRAAHQLKTPVTAIQTTLEVTLRKDRSKEELQTGLGDLNAAVRTMVSLTQKLLTSSRLSYQALPPLHAINLAQAIESQIRLLHSVAEQKKITCIIEASPAVEVLGTEPLLSDVFGNLLENAILYSKKGAAVSISWKAVGPEILVSVIDQGPGIPENVQLALFKPFVRGDERRISGSGLGLSIAFKASQILGGSIQLKQTNSSGSHFVITLRRS